MRNTLKKMSNITQNFNKYPDLFPERVAEIDWTDPRTNWRSSERVYERG